MSQKTKAVIFCPDGCGFGDVKQSGISIRVFSPTNQEYKGMMYYCKSCGTIWVEF